MGAQPKRRSSAAIVGKLWLPAVIAVVLAFVAFGVSRVRAGSEAISNPPAVDTIAPTVVSINPKNIVYQVFGDLGGGGKVVYADLDSAPVEVALTSLPWSYTVTTTSPAVTLSLVTQVQGGSVGCRIIVNGEVRDEKTVVHDAAAAACTVTAA